MATRRPVGPRHRTLGHAVYERALETPDHAVFTFIGDDGEETDLSCSTLARRAGSLARRLRERVGAGDRVILLAESGPDFVCGLYGCLVAGVVAVPVMPPDPRRLERTLSRLAGIVDDCGARLVLATSRTAAAREVLVSGAPSLGAIEWWTSEDGHDGELWSGDAPDPDALALLQYTSGSTASPRGVMLSHRNLISNVEHIRASMELDRSTRMIQWLPLYHDMGLIGGVINGGWTHFERCVLMSPQSFLQRPLRWLDAISRHRGTFAGGPNFGYELCLRRTSAEQRRGLDLGSWRVAFSGAEPVRAATLRRFSEAFAPVGFQREAFYPCYGLAEATLMVTGGRPEEEPNVMRIDPHALQVGRAVAVASRAEGSEQVGCGRAAGDLDLRIVDPGSHEELPAWRVGEIWIAGSSVAQGYWMQAAQTARCFHARLADGSERRYLRTGDLGFLDAAGELHVTGRLKDLIVLYGRNVHPEDVEHAIQRSHAGLRPGGTAAFGLSAGGEERLVVLQEVDPIPAGACEALMASIRQSLAAQLAIQVASICLVERRSLPKTSSGKLRRFACREAYEQGHLGVVARWDAALT